MQVPERVHISPLGYEKDRVAIPAIENNADIVYLIEHDEPENEKPSYHIELREEIQAEGIELIQKRCDIFDMYSVLGEVAEILFQHRDDDVYVNLATGSKICAIGGMIACMVARETVDPTPYYVSAESYSSEGEDDDEVPVAIGVEEISELPAYPIEGPSPDEIRMLQYIQSHGPIRKGVLITHARSTLPRFEKYVDRNDINESKTGPTQGEYRLLDSHILEPLLERDCIEIEEVGRAKEVIITPEGENTLRAFDYLLN